MDASKEIRKLSKKIEMEIKNKLEKVMTVNDVYFAIVTEPSPIFKKIRTYLVFSFCAYLPADIDKYIFSLFKGLRYDVFKMGCFEYKKKIRADKIGEAVTELLEKVDRCVKDCLEIINAYENQQQKIAYALKETVNTMEKGDEV